MSGWNFKSFGFRNTLKKSERNIRKLTEDGIQEHIHFKQLIAMFKSFLDKHPITGIKAILISQKAIENLGADFSINADELLKSEDFLNYDLLTINSLFKVEKREKRQILDNNQARRQFSKTSNENDLCVFLLSSEGVTYFVNGEDFGKNIFFSSEEKRRFIEKRGLEELPLVFEDYRKKHLTLRDTYNKFFVRKAGLKALSLHLHPGKDDDDHLKKFVRTHSQLLNNKPEDIFREDLRHYLKEKTKGSLYGKEYILEDFKRLDIYMQDEFGELIFIEVKWVGKSINPTGNKFGTEYKDTNICPDAINQATNYIKTLLDHDTPVKIGYLIVFDARGGDQPDTRSAFDEKSLNPGLEKYYSMLKLVPDFKVKNIHQS